MSSQMENQVVSPVPISSSNASFELSTLNPFSTTDSSNDEMTKTSESDPQELKMISKEFITSSSYVPLNENKDYMCKMNCIQHVEYHLNTGQAFHSHQLELLDIILNSNNALAYPLWFKECLVNCMEKYGFRLYETLSVANQQQGVYQFNIQRAFVNSPLSYILGSDAPHGVLQKMELVFNWTTANILFIYLYLLNSGEFQLDWNSTISDEFAKLLDSKLCKTIFPRYPLIFSSLYVTRLTGAIAFLPHVSTCLRKIVDISKVYSDTNFHQTVNQIIKTASHRTSIMHPSIHKASTSTELLIGLYHSVKMDNEKKTKTMGQKPPDAISSVSRIWSVSCSTSTSLE
ncbi:hypothetical protein K501DRAFT_266433 [Backusella circina FSU 941]|nr:hypothetical protein K501DRAFT_266433 [Backusella circina FSU 941]